ncbi:enolase C-terminal domain-like protein [Jiangella muralis]|uniref:enolase C-terminal domain-like protein n=1 Tax=Jiangella muralis TaxID=702383 RepID=UPI00069F0382|nr:enolase C-terminal domain-like protein [Jiangella muralis]
MKIIDIDVAVVRENDTPYDNAQQCAIVAVTAEDGTVGYGEANANPDAVKALLESVRGLTDNWDDAPRAVLADIDATDPRAAWTRLKAQSFWSCRAGLGHVALAGLDLALWDLAGKIEGVPTWQLLGPAVNPTPRSYVTLYFGPSEPRRTWERFRDGIDRAVGLGHTAVKIEPLPDNAPEPADVIALMERSRAHLGDDYTLLADVGYRWRSIDDALPVAREIDAFGLFALEAPFQPHQIEDYRRLHDLIETPIVTGDMLTAAVEYQPLLDAGVVSHVQGGAARTGISEMSVLSDNAARAGAGLIPWSWLATKFALAGNIAVAVTNTNVPLVEFRPDSHYPDSLLARTLAGPEPAVTHGSFDTPTGIGLGVDLDPAAFERFRVA